MKPVLLAAFATEDLREARTWYDQHVPGFGKKFIEAVDLALTQVGEHPHRYPIVHADIRRVLVQSFTYAIFFRDLRVRPCNCDSPSAP